jgi:hypothetical protein
MLKLVDFERFLKNRSHASPNSYEIGKRNMTAVTDTPFAKLEAEGRLLKPTLKADTHVEGRFGFRGDISYDGPESFIKEVFTVSETGKSAIGFLSGSIKAYEDLPKIVETFGSALDAEGKYLIYVGDIPRGSRWYIAIGDVKFFIVFIDDTSVYNELIDTFYVDKVKLKKYDTSAKLDALADVGLKYTAVSDYETVTYEEGLKRKNAG